MNHPQGNTACSGKIILLCSDLEAGGIQRVVVNLANGLAEKGMDIACAVLHRGGAFRSLLSPRVQLDELGCTSQPLALLSPSSRLIRYLGNKGPGTVVSFGHTTNNLAAWSKILRHFPFRLVVSEHSTFGARMAGDASFHRWRRTVRARLLYRRAESCVCVSQGVADDLLRLRIVPPSKVRVIYNPIVDASLAHRATEPVEHPWIKTGTVPVLLAVGRLIPLKGYDDLLRAFRLLTRELGMSARLVLLGDGPEMGHLQTLACDLGVSEEVHFAGYTLNPYSWMAKASALVLSSRCEGFANVLAEALACGINVVSTDCPSGPREILEDGRWGRLVPVGAVEALAHAMRETLIAPLPGKVLASAAQRFSVERSVSAWRELLAEPPLSTLKKEARGR